MISISIMILIIILTTTNNNIMRNIDEEAIYQAIIDANYYSKRITWGIIAGLLDCSKSTIYRNLTQELKKEKKLLNR